MTRRILRPPVQLQLWEAPVTIPVGTPDHLACPPDPRPPPVEFTSDGARRKAGKFTYCLDDLDPRMFSLMAALGRPYVWGAGDIKNAVSAWPTGTATGKSQGVQGYDCSGFVLAALIHLGIFNPASVKASDLGAMTLANMCDTVYDLVPGDLVIYPRHVMLYIGNGLCMGATGGGSSTHGDDLRGRVQVLQFAYRSDIFCGGRLKAGYRHT